MWLRTGNVNVTNGSAVVNGGTQSPMFVTNNVLPGYAFAGPDGRRYEVLSVQSETQLTLQRNYIGSTASNQAYEIEQNTGAAEADTKQRINELLTIFRTTAELTTLKVGNPTEAAAVAAFLGTLMSLENSGSTRLRLSKGTTGNDVYVEFAVGNSGRARIGLIGNNDIVFQTSPNGSSWTTRMTITSAGAVSLQGVLPIDSGGTGAASAAAARAALDVPVLGGSNLFSAPQTIQANTGSGMLTVRSMTDDNSGGILLLDKQRANPAVNDNGPAVYLRHRKVDGSTADLRFLSVIDDPQVATYANRLIIQTIRNGANFNRLIVGAGIYTGSMGDPGQNRVAAYSYGFPAFQQSSADPNTLDDYEEGSYTPGINIGGSVDGLTYTTQAGVYIKIGRLVYCRSNIQMSSIGSLSGFVNLIGLPFSVLNGGLVGYYWANMVGLGNSLFCNLLGGGTTGQIRTGGAAGASPLTQANLTSTSQMLFTGIYEVAA